jgi:hypothetical protein
MDVVFFTQNPQKSQNLLGCIFFTQNPQKSQNSLDAKFASHRDSYNSPYSACLKKRRIAILKILRILRANKKTSP